MKLNQLEIFCKIVELGSFSKAAEALHLSQPTLTEHIKSLEDYLGIIVLDRLGREILPTRAGEILYEYAQKINDLKKEAEEELKRFKDELKGELKVAASTIPGEYIVPGMLGRFREKFPSIHLSVMIEDTRRVIVDILNNKIELGIVGAKVEDQKIEYYRFATDELILVAPNLSSWGGIKSVTVEKLKEIPMVLREEGSGTRMGLEKALKKEGLANVDLKVTTTLGSTAAVIQAIKSGVGCSILSRRAVKDELEKGILKHIAITKMKIIRDFHIVLRRGKSKSPLCEAFYAFLLAESKELLA
jgi:DNA-binding transcriptional LysR family regulator